MIRRYPGCHSKSQFTFRDKQHYQTTLPHMHKTLFEGVEIHKGEIVKPCFSDLIAENLLIGKKTASLERYENKALQELRCIRNAGSMSPANFCRKEM
jgi:hypothetical protein